ncbi:FUSC family protein [Pseudomonas typographi]|uniref:FUSC family protein n=1 Tax=Pseudomonas typographi TaxID=2715964 RepID=A0ABR7YZ12_9PSED|nr:FUSC family protein [Pseudomonas typographi]MBD1550098.1 FUSC family protein [Pseudomonas typographi]MBD1585480.1 FUSC family protein [Pseudomonas typographi]MBD1598407.1 FUSC family protein [Pseudomonas typographi]
MNGFFSDVPPAQDWWYGLRTFTASMLALWIAMKLEMPRPYWAMATVYIVSSPFVGPTSSKAVYRLVGTFVGSCAAVLFVPLFVQTPYLLAIVIALWTGTLLYLSMHLRTANFYALMLAGYTLPLIALPVVDNPTGVFDVASSRTQEIFIGIVCAAVIGAVFWPRRLSMAVMGAHDKWFNEASTYALRYLTRSVSAEEVGPLRASTVVNFNGLEQMIGQLPHEGATPHYMRNTLELRGRMIHLLPVIDALDDALVALERRTPELVKRFNPLLEHTREWLAGSMVQARIGPWQDLHAHLDRLRPDDAALEDRRELLFANALYRLGELIDLWQDMRSLHELIRSESRAPWRAVYRHWRLGRLRPTFDHGMMLYSSLISVSAIIVASAIWIESGWADGGSAVILAAVSCSFFAAMDDPAPQIYRFFFWTSVAVVLSSLYLFVVLPNLHDFPMLVLAFAVPFIPIGALTVQPRFYLGTLLTIVNTASFISIQGEYDANFMNFINSNIAGPVGLLFAFCWTLIVRPFGTELAASRLTRLSWREIVTLGEAGTLSEHRRKASRMLDRMMQVLPRLANMGQDTGAALRDVRVALNLLDILAYAPRVAPGPRALLDQVVAEVATYFKACLKARRRVSAPMNTLMTMDRARRALNSQTSEAPNAEPARVQLLLALSGLRLALLPGVEMVHEPDQHEEQPPYGLDGAPL